MARFRSRLPRCPADAGLICSAARPPYGELPGYAQLAFIGVPLTAARLTKRSAGRHCACLKPRFFAGSCHRSAHRYAKEYLYASVNEDGCRRAKRSRQHRDMDKKMAAVCGLYCEACSWFISTTEDPERLKRLAAQLNWSEEESKCYGCRSGKRLPYCGKCRMSACAAERGIDFCSECEEYPCNDLKQFQSAMPHRIELWVNLKRIKSVGYKQWLEEIKENYTCPRCKTLNSTYDLKCRKCGEEPSCNFVAKHRQEIEQYLKSR